MRRCLILAGLCAALAGPALAQDNTAALAARQWRQNHERAIIDEFFSLLSLPNIARDQTGIQRNADMNPSFSIKIRSGPLIMTSLIESSRIRCSIGFRNLRAGVVTLYWVARCKGKWSLTSRRKGGESLGQIF
jgi:hypothetical protein